VSDQHFKQVGIVHDAGHHLPCLFVLIETQRQPLQMLVKVLAQIGHHTPTGDMRHVATQKVQSPFGNKRHGGHDRQARDV